MHHPLRVRVLAGFIKLGLILYASSCSAEGLVSFSTRVGADVNAPVYDSYYHSLVDSNYLGQLLAGSSPNELTPVGVPVPFRSDAGRGYITAGGTLVVPTENNEPGGISYIRFVAWSRSCGGTNYAQLRRHLACGAVVEYAQGEVLRLKTGRPDDAPARLIGLQGLTLSRPLSGWDFFTDSRRQTNGTFEAVYFLGTDGALALEKSSDLTHWEDSQDFTPIPPRTFRINVVLTNDSPAQFFRMRRLGCD